MACPRHFSSNSLTESNQTARLNIQPSKNPVKNPHRNPVPTRATEAPVIGEEIGGDLEPSENVGGGGGGGGGRGVRGAAPSHGFRYFRCEIMGG